MIFLTIYITASILVLITTFIEAIIIYKLIDKIEEKENK